MTCHCFSHYLLQCSSDCFLKFQIFMADNKDLSDDKNHEKLLDDSSSDEDTTDKSLKTTEEER